jgi:hypothetical protein
MRKYRLLLLFLLAIFLIAYVGSFYERKSKCKIFHDARDGSRGSYYLSDPWKMGGTQHDRLIIIYAPIIWIDENIFGGAHCVDAWL